MTLDPFEQALARVQGPGQYVGGEPNAVVKPEAAVRLALAFPDAYGVGMSYHGLHVLYGLVNARPAYACERVFAPWPDMEAELRAGGLPLHTLETRTPLHACDAVALSMTYELAATNALTILDLGGVPLTRFERAERAAASAGARLAGEAGCPPIVLAGGHATFNPEPFSDFVDAFVLGEGEEAILEILDILARRLPREETLRALGHEVAGVYVPALYGTRTLDDGAVVVDPEAATGPYPIQRRVVHDLDAVPPPSRPVVPIHEAVHERATIEVLRGCPNGCRFCQAGMVMRPKRQRSVATILEAARACYRHTGYDEIGLLSLSTSDHDDFDALVAALDAEFAPRGVSLSLPSLRVDHALHGLPARLRSVRKSGLTLAPEAGTDRLRAIINKDVTDADLLRAAEEAFSMGWRTIKLYFMVGLPEETDADVRAIGALAAEVAKRRRKGGRGPAVTCSISNFVPKPHTPFQWEPMARPVVLEARQALARQAAPPKRVACKGHDIPVSLLEGVLTRGDRRLGRVIRRVWEGGARFCAWSDHFQPQRWWDALAAEGLEAEALACVPRDPAAPLPWSHIATGVSTEFLRAERERAREGAPTPKCTAGQCAGCGAPRCTLAAGAS